MVDSLYCLRHNTVISSNNQNNNVGNLSATCTHCSKGFVTRSIDKGDLTTIDVYYRSANVLGNATSFMTCNTGGANSIKQRSFTMVNMTHYRNNWWTRLEILFRVVINNSKFFFWGYYADFTTKVISNKLDKFIAHRLGQGKSLSQHKQTFYHIIRRNFY